MTDSIWTPQKSANKLVRIVDTFSKAHETERFPIDVKMLALGAAEIFGWSDPISTVQEGNIHGFEGALYPDDNKKKWLLLYNSKIKSEGRVRFTQAHELGHYILHRHQRESFECSEKDMFDWSEEDLNIEAQADVFASYLLMPIDDFRTQTALSEINLEILGQCANRYGVSLFAAILKWLEHTEDVAVLVVSKDGFIDWASSSKPAMKAGAYFKTKTQVIPIPEQSLANNQSIRHEKMGQKISASIWFKHAESQLSLREMKLFAEQYDSVITLLCLPKYANVYPKECRFQ